METEGAPGEPGRGPAGSSRQPLTIHCYAKINLTLEVLGRYAGGYHRITSIMQTISLFDVLSIAPAEEITFHCDQPGLSGPDNLVVKAAMLLKEATGYKGGAHLRLEKRIPEPAGLGGGSSDAASALRGLNMIWNLRLPREPLMGLAARLGSDVPFFLLGGTALAEGRGERVEQVQGPGTLWLVLVRPSISLAEKTRTLYRSLTPDHYTAGEHTQLLKEALQGGKTLSDEMLFNVFEGVASSVFPGLAQYADRLLEAGATKVHLAGSGPTLFAIFEEREDAESVRHKINDLEAYLASTMPAED